MGLLEGKVAFITGGARGQGRAHALTCAREGADVVILDIAGPATSVDFYAMPTPADLAQTAKEIEQHDRGVLAIQADVRDQGALDAAVATALASFGQIDILIANAGIWTQNPFWLISDPQWEEMIGINLSGVWRAAKAVTPHMIERQRGSIVITSSVNGLEPGPQFAHYTAAKHGLLGLMKTIALELAPHGVRCNAICPGAVDTPMTNHQNSWNLLSGHEGGVEADFVEAGHRYGVLKGTSFLDPQVIADAALFLNSEFAAAITGVTLPVEAGHLLIPGVNHNPVR